MIPISGSIAGIALDDLGYRADAITSYDRAIALHPQGLSAKKNRSVVLQRLGRYGEAARGYDDILAQAPESDLALNGLANCALYSCDWSQAEFFMGRVRSRIEAGGVMQLGTVLGYFSEPRLHLAAARNYVRSNLPAPGPAQWRSPRFGRQRIRLAYCSANFHSHPMPKLLAGVFEHHDRTAFEILAISFGPDDQSDMRRRLIKSFDQFYDVAD
jgi:protein O-GlcNAc transferase